jgi:hypothetical protein
MADRAWIGLKKGWSVNEGDPKEIQTSKEKSTKKIGFSSEGIKRQGCKRTDTGNCHNFGNDS